MTEHVEIPRRCDCHAGNRAEISHVEHTVVCSAVLPDKTGSVKTESDRQALNRHIMYDMAVGSLKER